MQPVTRTTAASQKGEKPVKIGLSFPNHNANAPRVNLFLWHHLLSLFVCQPSTTPLPLLLLLLFCLSFPKGICCSSGQQSVVSHTAVVVVAFAVLFVIPEGNLLLLLLLPLLLLFLLSFPKGICCCFPIVLSKIPPAPKGSATARTRVRCMQCLHAMHLFRFVLQSHYQRSANPSGGPFSIARRNNPKRKSAKTKFAQTKCNQQHNKNEISRNSRKTHRIIQLPTKRDFFIVR